MTILDICIGIISGLTTSGLLYGLQWCRYKVYLYKRYHNRTFKTYWKGSDINNPDNAVHDIKCTVKQNIIKIEGTRISDGTPFQGEIIVNPITLRIGEGFHHHEDVRGFAFMKVIIKDSDTFLVEAPYISMCSRLIEEEVQGTEKRSNVKKKIIEDKVVPQAFIWKRVGR